MWSEIVVTMKGSNGIEKGRDKIAQHAKVSKWQRETRDVSHCGLAIYIKKYLHAKEEYNLQKNPKKETKILQDIILYN
jgi:hypothetical protein